MSVIFKSEPAARFCASLLLMLLALAACASGMFVFREGATSAERRSPAPDKAAAGVSYAKLPLNFEPNQGQADGAVKFLARGYGYRLSLLPDGATLALQGGNSTSERGPANVMHLKLVGANPAPRIEALNELPGKSNYFIGNDPKQWRTGVANYASVKYRNVYPGIDVVYYGNQGQLEYDFILQPGANPRTIKVAFSGVEQMRLEADGDLTLRAGGGEVRQRRPVIYQETNGAKQFVAGRYVQTGGQEVGFEIGDYDASKPLVIDPVLSYSSYLGGSAPDFGAAIAVDATGNIYLAGATGSANFPIANGAQANFGGGAFDCFVTKLNPSGTALIYSTYLGGSGIDEAFGLALDSSDNVYLAGFTASTNFPAVGALQQSYGGGNQDAFVAKLSANGSSLAYSTYLGGSGSDRGNGIAVDGNGAAYIIGQTTSTNLPVKNALQPAYGGGGLDAFVAKVQPDGAAFVFATYLGGSDIENSAGIGVDAAGNTYLSGSTNSNNFPTTANAFQRALASPADLYIAKLNAEGSAFIYSTYLGGSGGDTQLIGNPLAIDAAGNVYVTGATNSSNFPTANPLQANYGGAGDAFVTKLNVNGTALIFSTYLGGSGTENLTPDGIQLSGIAVDGAGQVYVTGTTNSTNFPTANAVQATFGGVFDVFVTKLNASGSAIIYSTYFGGSSNDDAFSIAVDPIGNAYVTGRTLSTNLRTVNAFQAAYGAGIDAFILKLGADAVTVSAASFSGAAITSKAIVAAFGPNLATSTVIASSVPLPTTLAGTTVRIRDSAGVERDAPLFFVSAGQVNYQIPDGTAAGPAAVTVTSGDGRISSAVIQVRAAAPAIFTANASGSGAAAAVDAFTGAAAPFNATRAGGEPNIISVFGTGLGADATDIDANVSATATIDGNPATVLYAGRAPGFVGLNQFNVVFHAGITAGTHTLVISRNGVASNTVTIAIR